MRRRRPALRGRFEERAGLLPPAGREAFFLAPFRARARKEPRRGVDGLPALFEKGMLIDAQEHRDVLVPHSLRHTFDVRPVHKRQRGEGVPQVIRPDAPRDARPAQCQPLEMLRTGRPL